MAVRWWPERQSRFWSPLSFSRPIPRRSFPGPVQQYRRHLNPAPGAKPPTAASLARVVAGYWQSWGGPSLKLRDVPPAYNLVFAAFAVGDATGKINFSQTVQSKSSFIKDVEALNKADRPVLLSVGGWDDGGLKITTDGQRRAFVNSASKIIDSYHFAGIDWDLEHGIDPVQVAQATRDLKSRYGRDFIVTMAPLLEPATRDSSSSSWQHASPTSWIWPARSSTTTARWIRPGSLIERWPGDALSVRTRSPWAS